MFLKQNLDDNFNRYIINRLVSTFSKSFQNAIVKQMGGKRRVRNIRLPFTTHFHRESTLIINFIVQERVFIIRPIQGGGLL